MVKREVCLFSFCSIFLKFSILFVCSIECHEKELVQEITLATNEYKSFAKCLLHYCFINVSPADDLNQRDVLNGVF